MESTQHNKYTLQCIFLSKKASVIVPEHSQRCVVVVIFSGCSSPMGMEKRLVPNHSISASSFLKTWFLSWSPSLARLNLEGNANAWRPKVCFFLSCCFSNEVSVAPVGCSQSPLTFRFFLLSPCPLFSMQVHWFGNGQFHGNRHYNCQIFVQ